MKMLLVCCCWYNTFLFEYLWLIFCYYCCRLYRKHIYNVIRKIIICSFDDYRGNNQVFIYLLFNT